MEDVIMVSPHTLEVSVVVHKKCTTCRRVLPLSQYQELTEGDTTGDVGDATIACGWQSRIR